MSWKLLSSLAKDNQKRGVLCSPTLLCLARGSPLGTSLSLVNTSTATPKRCPCKQKEKKKNPKTSKKETKVSKTAKPKTKPRPISKKKTSTTINKRPKKALPKPKKPKRKVTGKKTKGIKNKTKRSPAQIAAFKKLLQRNKKTRKNHKTSNF